MFVLAVSGDSNAGPRERVDIVVLGLSLRVWESSWW